MELLQQDEMLTEALSCATDSTTIQDLITTAKRTALSRESIQPRQLGRHKLNVVRKGNN
jgi:hypothetical protein